MKRQRVLSLRSKITAVLVSLAALWAFAAYVTVGEGVSLVWLATLEQQVAKPTEAVIAAVQEERRESVAFAAAGATGDRSALDRARTITDQAESRLRNALQTTAGQWSTSTASDAKHVDLLAGLDTLRANRAAIDSAQMNRVAVYEYFNSLTQLGYDVYDTYTAWDDDEVIFQTSTLVLLTHSQEMVSKEDAVIMGVMADGSFTEGDRSTFAQLVGAQRYLSKQVSERLPEPDRTEYLQLLRTEPLRALADAEARIISAPIGVVPVADVAQWRTMVTEVIEALRTLVLRLADLTVERVAPAAIWIIVRLILAAGLGLIAVIASIRFTIRTLRNLQHQLGELRVAAYDLAHERLPSVVERLRRGEDVNVNEASPPLRFGADDIGQVGEALNYVQQTAIRATVEQAELRRGVRDMFLSLAHRIQGLVHRQIKLIDTMEREAGTDDELANLFQIDHLATRMRRNAENLIVLSGVPAGRVWRSPVPMVDVLRGALAEVEGYERVKLRFIDPEALAGRAVGDVIHLLAELMENAVTFSPPYTDVLVSGQIVAAGYAVEIRDRGFGMTTRDLEEANAHITTPSDFQMSGAARLGFYVVGRLAQRHHIKVALRQAADGGLIATVVIPMSLLSDFGSLGAVISAPSRQVEARPHGLMAAVATLAPPAETKFTPAGLPWRERPIRTKLPVVQSRPEPDAMAAYPNGRSPEEVSRFMAAYVNAVKRIRHLDQENS